MKPKEIAPEIVARYASWSGSHADEAFGYLLNVVKWQCLDKVGADLFDLHVMFEHAADLSGKFERVKDWAYGAAVEYSMVNGIRWRPDWGRQAARDGVFLAMWPDEKSTVRMPTISIRAIEFGIWENNYSAVRGYVRDSAVILIDDFNEKLEAGVKRGF
mgnify:CR=1 FL=1